MNSRISYKVLWDAFYSLQFANCVSSDETNECIYKNIRPINI